MSATAADCSDTGYMRHHQGNGKFSRISVDIHQSITQRDFLVVPRDDCSRWQCERHDLALVSDEIHSGLVLDKDKQHIPIASIGNATERTVALLSASKTFNLPGLGCAFAIASNAQLRQTMAGIVHHVGALGFFATLAAYRDGHAWQLALLDYLRTNRDLVETRLSAMPGLRTWHVEATYLAWIDARDLPVTDPVAFFEDAGVGLYDGSQFGAAGYLRLNFACARNLLTQSLDRMQKALASI